MDSEYPILVSSEGRFSLAGKLKFEIGRNSGADLIITSSFVSRSQCSVFKDNQDWKIVNKSNQKTTYVNQQLLEESHLLQDGDKISFSRYPEEIVFLTAPTHNNANIDALRQKYEDQLAALQRSNQLGSLKIDVLLNQTKEQCKQIAELNQKDRLAAEKINVLTDQVTNLEQQKAKLASYCSDHTHDMHDFLRELELKHKEELDKLNSPAVSSAIKPDTFGDMIESDLLKKELAEKGAKLKEVNELLQKVTEERDTRFEMIVQAFESEMTCCVCSDIIYEATILNCKHTFCKECLNEWKKTRKECPECRTKIKSEVRNLKIDAFIERVTPYLGPSYVTRREEIIKERTKPPISVTPVRQRGNRTNRRTAPYALNTVSLDHLLDEAYGVLINNALDIRGPLQNIPPTLPSTPAAAPRLVTIRVRRRASTRRGRANNREI